jgi:hypothetical protein
MKLDSARIELAPVGKDKPAILSLDLGAARVVHKSVDVSGLAPGQYTIRLVGRDRADNEAFVSRDITVSGERKADKVELLFPVEGEFFAGPFRVTGRVSMGVAGTGGSPSGGASSATILLDGRDAGVAPLSALGYFSFALSPEAAAELKEGGHLLQARAVNPEGKVIESRKISVSWSGEGPWASIDSLATGAYLPERPWLSGSAGWTSPAPDPNDPGAVAAFKKGAASRAVSRVELSLDNGRTFHAVSGKEKWRFRLETQDYSEGELFIIVRAWFPDGRNAVSKAILRLDKTLPEIRVAEPAENGRYNQSLRASGMAQDASGLEAVALSLRKGDKRGYELPAFIQGLYLDGHAFGATQWEAGLGLTFFNDNVKLQANYGRMPELWGGEEQRFFGDVLSAKLIANVLFLPFSSFLGPDWDFLSASLGVGAQFNYFTMPGSTPQGISAVIGQVEFPKVTLRSLSFMKKYSFYFEEQLWFISSESQPEFRPASTLGVRIGIF